VAFKGIAPSDPRKYSMNELQRTGFAERLSAAADAKRAMLAKFKPRPTVAASLPIDRAALRKAELDRVRSERAALKTAKQQAIAQAAEAARLDEEELAAAALEAKRGERKERKALTKAEQKAKRDARYAARKARR
jgi:hypothetical protein